jgi:hypothetical protein
VTLLTAFFVRKGRKGRKESKGDYGVKRSHSATVPFLLSFASFASFADKCFYSITCGMFGESIFRHGAQLGAPKSIAGRARSHKKAGHGSDDT